MSLAIERHLTPAPGHPTQHAVEQQDLSLNIAVVFTSVESTLAALKEAGALAQSLGAQITLLVPQVVPYPLPLESPPVLIDFSEKRFHVIASQSSVETKVCIYLCRDRLEALKSVLRPGSIVVIGGRKRWWPTGEERLAHKLRKAGHEVFLKQTE
ncbi:MAG: hypothetical protein JWO19_2120 [Bryobacterales bacterium]|nr:hypothetical protein [Bryobacterales bacterium]